MNYDYLIVGSGLYGSILAHELSSKGKKVLVLEKRNHIGGNCYTEKSEGINIHKYGPHIFHTENENIWNYMKKFTDFNGFIYRPKVKYKDTFYSFPINLNTLNQVYGITTPEQAKTLLNKLKTDKTGDNLEEHILSQIGLELYTIFIKGYTHKQWGKEPKELPNSIIKRIPVRTTWDDNYFHDYKQGIPIDGYTKIFQRMLSSVEVRYNIDYLENKSYFDSIADKIIFTGRIDEFYNYEFGELEYRSLHFENEFYEIPDKQGCAVINHTEYEIPYTRTIEHKHFEFSKEKHTILTKEYPQKWDKTKEAFYPVADQHNLSIFQRYKDKSSSETKYFFGGRLANYKYYDMSDVVALALKDIEKSSFFV